MTVPQTEHCLYVQSKVDPQDRNLVSFQLLLPEQLVGSKSNSRTFQMLVQVLRPRRHDQCDSHPTKDCGHAWSCMSNTLNNSHLGPMVSSPLADST